MAGENMQLKVEKLLGMCIAVHYGGRRHGLITRSDVEVFTRAHNPR